MEKGEDRWLGREPNGRFWAGLALACALAGLALAPVRPQAPVVVSVVDNAFTPASLEILPGQTVRWENTGFNEHNVVALFGAFDSGPPRDGPWSFEVRFDQPGVYEYVCVPHQSIGMTGTIVVKPAVRVYLPLLPAGGSGG